MELILVNGESVDFSYLMRDEPLRDTKFIADAHLGELARLLRMLGFDTT